MIGDVLTSSILFEALRKKYPNAQLHYLIYKHTLPVVENNPFIDRVLLFEEKDKKGKDFLDFLQKIKAEKYNLVIDAYSKVGTAILSAFSGAKERISYHKWYTSSCYTNTVKRIDKPTTIAGLAVENRMQLLQPLSSEFPKAIKPKIYLDSSEINAASDKLSSGGINQNKMLIMISVLGSSAEKTYPKNYLAKLLDLIVEQSGAQLLFNYIPAQKSEALEIYNATAPKTQGLIYLNLFGKSLREFISLTYHCNALIGNEGGAVNMAKALDIPTFAIFSPPVNKEDWALYEDDKKHVSVHLKDYKPDLFAQKKTSDLKRENKILYKEFTPDLMEEKIKGFLKYLEK